MPDWKASMQQTFEYYTVDPGTWKDVKRLEHVTSCRIDRDSEADTLGSATFEMTEPIGEQYVRVYLITIQNGVKERHPLGTFLVQTPASSFDGKVRSLSMDAYTPLIELKENQPPVGYNLRKNTNIMRNAYQIVRDNVRAPVVETECSETLYSDFVADPDEYWITFTRDLIANAKYIFYLDELGRILFSPKQNVSAMQPIWTYTDDNSSILYPDLSMNRDMYGIPNVFEAIYSKGPLSFHARIVNDDPNSPISTVNRGREIITRVTNPEGVGNPINTITLESYAENALKELSTLEWTVSYTHAYCPVRLGDCVRLNYTRSDLFSMTGLTDVKAKVISQTIKCEPGCPVSEKAVFTTKLWR